MAIEREKIYECEVKRRRVKVGGGYEPFWKVKTVAEALADSDAEFCANGILFKKATDGREAKPSEHPVL